MDGIMIEFPLSCLSFPVAGKDKVEMIISYCIVEHSKKIKTSVDSRISALDKFPAHFNKSSKEHKRIVLAAEELGISLGTMPYTIENHSKLFTFCNNQKLKYGKDSFCRVGKKLCFEVRDGTFEYKNFAVLCAIQSILGKKTKFKRITKDRIRYAMKGYKSKGIALQNLDKNEMLLTDRKLFRIIDFLHAKKFFSKFTYARRQTFFSTRLNDEQLIESVGRAKLFWAEKRRSIKDIEATNKIKAHLRFIRLNYSKVRSA